MSLSAAMNLEKLKLFRHYYVMVSSWTHLQELTIITLPVKLKLPNHNIDSSIHSDCKHFRLKLLMMLHDAHAFIVLSQENLPFSDCVLHLLHEDHSHSAQGHDAFPVAVVLWGTITMMYLTIWPHVCVCNRSVPCSLLNNDWEWELAALFI